MAFLSARGNGNMLSSRSQRSGVPLGLLNTSRRERSVLNLASTQVSSKTTKRDEISGAFGELLKPGVVPSKIPRARQKVNGKVAASRTSSAARNRKSARRIGTANKVSAKTMVTPAQVKNTLRNSWYRLRSTVQSFQEIENGQIQLGQMYALCQNHLLGLDTEQTSTLLADSMGTNDATAAGETEAGGFDSIEVVVGLILPVLEQHIQQQWDKVNNALEQMPAKLKLGQVQKILSMNGVIMTVGELCHVPDWTVGSASARSGMSSSRSSRSMLRTRQGKMQRASKVDNQLKEKIKRTWRRMNECFRKECVAHAAVDRSRSRRGGMVDMRQLNAVLSKFGIQLAHDDLIEIFSKFDNNRSGL